MTDEQQLFDWPVTPEKRRRRAAPPETVDRIDGWVLVVNEGQPHQWHLAEPIPGNVLGGVITKCNLIGRIVPDECEKIVLCPECRASAKRPPV